MDLLKIFKNVRSEKSKVVYISRIKVLEKLCDTDIETICLNADKYIPIISSKYDNPKTLKSFYTVIMSLFKHDISLNEKTDAYARWLRAYLLVNKDIEDLTNKNIPTEKQQSGYVPFLEFKEKAKTLRGYDKLLVMMYSSIPAMRADFGKISMYVSSIPKEHTPNYLFINKTGCKLVITEYKTAKSMGKIEEMLPADLCKEIKASLKVMPRDYLFENQFGHPFTDDQFGKWVSQRFLKIFGKPLTINILRHSYISHLDFNKLSIEEKARIARFMGHSVNQQDRYRLFFKKEDENDKD